MRRLIVGWLAMLAVSLFQNARAADIRLESFLSPPLVAQVQVLRLKENLRRAAETGEFVGLGVAVVRGGEVTLLYTYGETEIGTGDPVTPDTVFRIASLSKAFASSMTSLAVSEGRLSLDTPAASFAPELSLPGGSEKSLTLADILSHRTGLPPNAFDNLLEEGVAPGEIIKMYRGVKPTCPVSECYAYQNVTYDLAGRALARAYDKPFAGLVEDRLFAPLGMKTASYGLDGLHQSASWARPHSRERRADPNSPPQPWTTLEVKTPYYAIPAAGGVNASIRDMSQWLKAQLGHVPDVLPAEVLQPIHAPKVSTPTETSRMLEAMPGLRSSHYGFGWRIYNYAGHRIVAHGGSVDGFAAQIMLIPDQDTGIVVLSNARSRTAWGIGPMFVDLNLGLPPRDWLGLQPPEPEMTTPNPSDAKAAR